MLEAAYDLLRDNLTQQLDIDSNLAFVDKCMGKYELDEAVRQELVEQIAEIRQKQKDKRFNVSVIGEFSTGKSTFINALLKQNLLKANSLQGTTVASTIIEHDAQMCVEVQYQGGECRRYPCRDMQALRNTVIRYTSGIAEYPDSTSDVCSANPASEEKDAEGALRRNIQENRGKQVDCVHIQLPTHLADGEIRIVDTPGTNVLDLWQEDVTRQAIRRYSDTSIVLINAMEPLPESFLNFLHENLEDIIRQCIFVVTKIDLVRPKERDAILQYIRVKLKTEFEIDQPVLMTYASLFVLEDAMETGKADSGIAAGNPAGNVRFETDMDIEKTRYRYGDRDELVEQSLLNERRIYQYVKQQRCLIQTKQMALLLERMFECLTGRMIELSRETGNERKLEEIARTSRSIQDRQKRLERIRKNLDGLQVYY